MSNFFNTKSDNFERIETLNTFIEWWYIVQYLHIYEFLHTIKKILISSKKYQRSWMDFSYNRIQNFIHWDEKPMKRKTPGINYKFYSKGLIWAWWVVGKEWCEYAQKRLEHIRCLYLKTARHHLLSYQINNQLMFS